MQKGFTLVELIIVVGIITILFGFIGFNLTRAQIGTSTQSTLSALIADIKSQQIKAMEGATTSSGTSDDYSIYFQSDKYTLFHGNTYYPSPPDNSNFVVTLSGVALSTTLPNNLLIFSKISGEVEGWSQGNNTITLTNIVDKSTKTLTINQLGVIISIQ